MKKELALFSIEDSCCGNQDRMVNPWMKLGGCAALAAVDSCILLTLRNGFHGICPIDSADLNWESYNRFAEAMRPYLSPRMMGVNRLSYYLDGFSAYLRDSGCRSLSMEALPMGTPAETARECLKEQIDSGFPVPILHLNPKTSAVQEYRWHWFLLTGYEETEESFLVKAVTFGEAEWLGFSDLWHETDPENGGLILYRVACPPSSFEVVKTASAIICDRPHCPGKILAAYNSEGEPYRYFPKIAFGPEEDPEAVLTRELAETWKLRIAVAGLLAIHEYDAPPFHISERCYKAVLQANTDSFSPENGGLVWLSEEQLQTAPWRSHDLPLINIIRSDMTDADVIRKRIAQEESSGK